MKKLLTIIALLLIVCTVQAQYLTPAGPAAAAPQADTLRTQPTVDQSDLMNMSVEDYIGLHLPPLHVLLENARERSSQVNMFTAKTEEQERELKTLRRSWLKYIKLNTSISYGTTDSSSELYYDNRYPVVQNVTGTTQRWWNVGASINLPLDEIFNRRNRIKQQQRRITSIQYETESWYDDICLKIIDAYATAVEMLSVLESEARVLITARAQYSATESDFINGKADAVTLARQRSIESDAFRVYQQTRSTLNKALLQLEVLSKTPIISKPVQTEPKK